MSGIQGTSATPKVVSASTLLMLREAEIAQLRARIAALEAEVRRLENSYESALWDHDA